jgi:uncharacterized membrane protein YheB (UPF0754 family)
MNQLLEWLKSGNLISDGLSNEVVRFVKADLNLLGDLVEGLADDDDVVRGHTADALEKLARSDPERVKKYLPIFIQTAEEDSVPMVRWHVAMILGHLSVCQDHVDEITVALIDLLSDQSVFTQSWAIVSLCIVARLYPVKADQIVNAIASLKTSGTVAIRSKMRKALPILTNEQVPFPKGWIKSEHLFSLMAGDR